MTTPKKIATGTGKAWEKATEQDLERETVKARAKTTTMMKEGKIWGRHLNKGKSGRG